MPKRSLMQKIRAVRAGVKRIRALRPSMSAGRALRQANIEVMTQRARELSGFGGERFTGESVVARMARLADAVLPKRAPRVSEKRAAAKRALTARLFPNTLEQRVGLLVIKPELFYGMKEFRRFLEAVGCEIVFQKSFVFSKAQIHKMYEHAIKAHWAFPIHVLGLLSGLSRVVVFKHPPKDVYMQKSRFLSHLKAEKPRQYRSVCAQLRSARSPQDVFNTLFKGSFLHADPGTLRGDIVFRNLKQLGFHAGTLTGLAKTADALDFYQKVVVPNPKLSAIMTLNGVHVPSQAELSRDAEALLSLSDLRKIAEKAGLKGK